MSEQSEQIPAAPTTAPTVNPVYVHEGSRVRLGYIRGYGQDYFGVWDRLSGTAERFPLTDDGWAQAWRAYTAAEALPADAAQRREGIRLDTAQGTPAPMAPAPASPTPPPPSGSWPAPAAEVAPPAASSRRGGRLIVAAIVVAVVAIPTIAFVVTKPGGVGNKAILKDDFSDPSSGWKTNTDARGSIGYVNGAYQMTVNKAKGDLESFATLSGDKSYDGVGVAADALASGGKGYAMVACSTDSFERFYGFAFSPDDGSYLIVKVNSDGGSILAQGTVGFSVQAAGTNVVSGQCVADGSSATRLSLQVNGNQVREVEDQGGFTRFFGLGLGVLSADGGTTIRFDNATITRA
jgi:hypothetical protein